MPITVENAPAIASALLALRGETQASLSKKSGIRVANLSVWLRGKKDQVISEKRVTALLECLGVEGGRLKKFAIHDWAVAGNISLLKLVLDELVPETDRSKLMVLTESRPFDLANSALLFPLEDGFAAVKLNMQSDLMSTPVLTSATLGYGQFYTTRYTLPSWPSEKLESSDNNEQLKNELISIEKNLLGWIQSDAETRGLDSRQLVEYLLQDIPGAKESSGGWNPGFDALSSVLTRLFDSGYTAGDIAEMISKRLLV